MVCTFSRGVEAFSTLTKRTREVVKAFLGLPLTLGNKNDHDFVANRVQQLVTAIGIKWKLHTAWRTQSSGKVERVKQTLLNNNILGKLCFETRLPWVSYAPISLAQNQVHFRADWELTI